MKPELDLRMYVVTKGTDETVPTIAAQCAKAGAGIIQVRAKELTTRELMEFTRRVARAVHQANPYTAVVVDDRVDVAWALRSEGEPVHGVHLGADDLPPIAARAILGSEAIVGFTTGTLELVHQAQKYVGVVDYLGAGPFRPTPTKDSGRAPLGVDGYLELVAASKLPIVAIGDVKVSDVVELSRTGIAGVAMVREVMDAENPAAIVEATLAAFE